MRAHKVKLPVPASRRVEIELPADFPEGDVEIIALAAERSPAAGQALRPGSIEAMRAARSVVDAMEFPRRTKEEVDQNLAEERASWGDEA